MTKFQHHWSGWPGAYCLLCVSDCKVENALADPQHSVDCAGCPRCAETSCISDEELLIKFRTAIQQDNTRGESIFRAALKHRLENFRIRHGN